MATDELTRSRLTVVGTKDGDLPEKGDLDRLYEEHVTTVSRWVRRLIGPRADVEDLIHDVFLVAMRRQADFRGEASLRTWLFGITNHVVRGRRRREGVRRLLFSRFEQESDNLGNTPVSPLEEIERRQRTARLYRALDRLPEADRTVLILFEIDGLPGDEVAELVGIDVGTLWVRLHRGRAKLLRALLKDGET